MINNRSLRLILTKFKVRLHQLHKRLEEVKILSRQRPQNSICFFFLKEEIFAVSWFFAQFAKVYSAKFFKINHPRKFIPTKYIIYANFIEIDWKMHISCNNDRKILSIFAHPAKKIIVKYAKIAYLRNMKVLLSGWTAKLSFLESFFL